MIMMRTISGRDQSIVAGYARPFMVAAMIARAEVIPAVRTMRVRARTELDANGQDRRKAASLLS